MEDDARKRSLIDNVLLQLAAVCHTFCHTCHTIAGMSHLDILIPFGLPPKELATDLFRNLNTPALATLIARAKFIPENDAAQPDDGFARTLPHEAWLTTKFGLAPQMNISGSPPIATAAMCSLGIAEEPGQWFIVSPVHFHIARDHLVLTDPRQLALSEADSHTLFEIAQPLFSEVGKKLIYGDATTWFARADEWAQLQTSTPDAASGHNIDIWMPSGEGARSWRKLQNEVQMHWFTSAVNAGREEHGLKPVNSIWLWGGAPSSMQPEARPYTDAFNLHGWMRAFEQLVGRHASHADAATVIASSPQRGLLVLDHLLEAALNNDWGSWQLQLKQLESDWFAPLLVALKVGRLDHVTLIPTHHAKVSTFAANKRSLYKFWRKPSLAPLTK